MLRSISGAVYAYTDHTVCFGNDTRCIVQLFLIGAVFQPIQKDHEFVYIIRDLYAVFLPQILLQLVLEFRISVTVYFLAEA